MLEKGIQGAAEIVVTPEVTAAHLGSGAVAVFATPMMIALVEKACMLSVRPFLEEGQDTVGTQVNISHSAASPLGSTVRCETTLVEVDRRRLVFSAKVYDDDGIVGEGTHERFIIDRERFLAKVEKKRR